MPNVLKTCINGHKYDESYRECPYCPQKTILQSTRVSGDKTEYESNDESDKTMFDLNVEKPIQIDDQTKVHKGNPTLPPPLPHQPQQFRKLVGWLVTFDLDPAGTDFQIREGKARIGRGKNNDFVIPQTEVSEEHFVLLFRNEKLMMEDRLSTNGTFLNGEMIEDKSYINNDDIITIGKVNLKVKLI